MLATAAALRCIVAASVAVSARPTASRDDDGRLSPAAGFVGPAVEYWADARAEGEAEPGDPG